MCTILPWKRALVGAPPVNGEPELENHTQDKPIQSSKLCQAEEADQTTPRQSGLSSSCHISTSATFSPPPHSAEDRPTDGEATDVGRRLMMSSTYPERSGLACESLPENADGNGPISFPHKDSFRLHAHELGKKLRSEPEDAEQMSGGCKSSDNEEDDDDSSKSAMRKVLIEELDREIVALQQFERKLKELRDQAAKKVLSRDFGGASWQVQGMNSVKSQIRKKVVRVLELSSALSLPYYSVLAEPSFETSQSGNPRYSSGHATHTLTVTRRAKRVLFLEGHETIGSADEDYDREATDVSPTNRVESLALRIFGTYPDELPELFGYTWS